MEQIEHLHREVNADKIKLSKYQKGDYGWEISIHGEDDSEMIKRIKGIDDKLKIEFAQKEGE